MEYLKSSELLQNHCKCQPLVLSLKLLIAIVPNYRESLFWLIFLDEFEISSDFETFDLRVITNMGEEIVPNT